MRVLQSWEDQNAHIYAIVQHSKRDQRKYRIREFEALWMIDNELYSFGGSVGYGIAEFDLVEDAQDFLVTGISTYDADPDIWLRMVEVT